MYDKVLEKSYNGNTIRYGIMSGNDRTLLLKVGQNGSIEGYQDKYMKMAHNLNSTHGITVVVSENPYDRTDSLQQAVDVIGAECQQSDWISYVGISNGAILGARFAYNHPEIKKLLLINGPLMINWPQTARGIEKFSGESVTFVYGDKDPSFSYVPILDAIKSNCRIEVRTVEGADHQFTGMEGVLRKIIEDILR